MSNSLSITNDSLTSTGFISGGSIGSNISLSTYPYYYNPYPYQYPSYSTQIRAVGNGWLVLHNGKEFVFTEALELTKFLSQELKK